MTLGSMSDVCRYVHCSEERTLQCRLNSGFHRDAEQTCVLLGYYAAYRGKPCRRFGSTYRSRLQGPLKMGTTGCPERSVCNYHYTLQNIPEERISHLAVMFLPERTPVRLFHDYVAPSSTGLMELRKSFLPILEISLPLEDGDRSDLRMFINQPMIVSFSAY
jgi:hypothetical protein